MAKHRSTIFTVVREQYKYFPGANGSYTFSTICGSYASIDKAYEEVGVCEQAFKDAGILKDDYRFSVHTNTYYDE